MKKGGLKHDYSNLVKKSVQCSDSVWKELEEFISQTGVKQYVFITEAIADKLAKEGKSSK